MNRSHVWGLVLGGLLVAGGATYAAPVSVTVDVSPVTRYVWRGYDINGGSKFPIQPSVTIAHESGLSFNWWGSWALLSRSDATNPAGPTKNQDEMDWTLDFSRNLNKKIGYSIGGIFYTYPNAMSTRTSEIYIGGSYATMFSPSLKVYYDNKWLDASGHKASGWYFSLSGSQSVPVAKQSVDLSAALGFEKNSTFTAFEDFDLGATTSFTSGPFSVSPFINAVFPMTKNVNSSHFLFLGGLTLGWSS